MVIEPADIAAAQARLHDVIRRTPCTYSQTLSVLFGCELFLKFEQLQFTASFKERGALNRLLALTDAERARGVVCMSAGNHAQAVAYHARRLGIHSTIVMPRLTPNAKVEHTRHYADDVILHGASLDEARMLADQLVRERNLVLVHPYNDPWVIAGQSTMTLEILQQVPDLDVLIVPVGGGGMIAGAALALESLASTTTLVGVQSERFPFAYCQHQHIAPPDGPLLGTVAEGIAVKYPGDLTAPIMQRRVNDFVLVDETAIEDAMVLLLDVEKSVVEGAGAVGLAAVAQHGRRWAGKRVCVVVSGGNVDLMMLTSIIHRNQVRAGRLVRIGVELPDVPGGMAEVARLFGELDSNIVEIQHNRDFATSSVRSVVVEFVLQMRGEEQVERVLAALREQGYAAEVV